MELEHLVDHPHELEVDENLIRQIEEQSNDILAEMINQLASVAENLVKSRA